VRRLPAALVLAALPLAGCGDDAGAGAAAAERWRTLRDATIARTEVAAARVGDGAYVVGGFAAPDGATTAAVERYDLRRDSWTRVAPLPQAVNHAAAVGHRGALYVVGGYTARSGLGRETGALWRLDPGADRWTALPDAPTARGALAAGVIGDRLYVVGGVARGRALRRLEIYDFRTRRWSRGPAMRTAREHLAAAVHGGALYVLAGRAAGRGNFAVAERYVAARRRWERLRAMRKPRGGIAAATVGRRVVVVGGEEAAGTIAQVESLDPRSGRWRPEPPLPRPRHGLGAVSFGGSIFVLAGGPTPGLSFSATTEALRVRG
jgi:N-acetylneuraminic acid mutarotase